MVRSTIVEGHSHVWALPATKPAERGVFFSEPDDRTDHSHALFYGGDRGPGLLRSEPYGDSDPYVWTGDPGEKPIEARRGDVNPEQPDPSRRHNHVVTVLL